MKKYLHNFLILVLFFAMPTATLVAQQSVSTKVKGGKRYEKTATGMDVYDIQTNQKLESFLDNQNPEIFRSLGGEPDCSEDYVEVILSITLDYMGGETYWSIHENPDQIPYDGVNDPTYVGPEVIGFPSGTYPNNVQGTVFLVPICLLPGCYSLVFGDEYGDGMGLTSGHYELYNGDSLLVSGGGNFGQWASDVFCVVPQVEPVLGCTDESACNFYPGATISDGSCIYPGSPCEHINPLVVEDHYNEWCECVGTIYYGCTDSTAFNFSEIAAVDDGSCYYNPGCTINFACNFDPLADFEDGSCEFLSCQVIGCIDIWASNYDPEANTPDPNLCEYETPSFVVVQSCNQIMIVNTTPEAPVQGVGVWGEWQFGDNQFLISLNDTLYHSYENNGNYEITFNYFQGAAFPQSCSLSIVVDDFESQPSIEIFSDGLLCTTEADIYVWYHDDILVQQGEESFLLMNDPGNYHCEVQNTTGCSAISQDFLVTGVEENTQTELFVYPTHVQDFLTIRDYDGFITIYDAKGSIVLEHNARNQKVVDLSYLGSGMYFVRTKEGSSQRIVKI